MAVQVLDRVLEQFVLNQIKKQNKKASKVGQTLDMLDQINTNNKAKT
jgi:hypothetical protein